MPKYSKTLANSRALNHPAFRAVVRRRLGEVHRDAMQGDRIAAAFLRSRRRNAAQWRRQDLMALGRRQPAHRAASNGGSRPQRPATAAVAGGDGGDDDDNNNNDDGDGDDRGDKPKVVLEPDVKQISRFVRAVFKHAAASTFVSLRAFEREVGKPIFIRGFQIEEGGLDSIIAAAVAAAREAANYPQGGVVFAPPTATFDNRYRARQSDLVNGLVISTECDEHPLQALKKLASILGSPTLVVESGGLWINLKTGEIEPKLHLYWRLKVPARDQEGFGKLREAREIATRIVGADHSNISIVHPIRWAGSWHTKAEPRLSRIVRRQKTKLISTKR